MKRHKLNHLFIPDVQAKPGVPLDHLEALGNYIVDKKPTKLICIGDFADMPSLSSYEQPGTSKAEGQRYSEDIAASHQAMQRLLNPVWQYNNKRYSQKKAQYRPEMHMFYGNHENRIERAVAQNPRHFEGVISLDDLEYEGYGWKTYPYKEIEVIDGIAYSHTFSNPDSLINSEVTGTIENRLKLLGISFSMGHQQCYKYGIRHNAIGQRLHGLVAGKFYMHDEDYLGPQGNNDWSGVILKQQVRDGMYDPQTISMEYLLEEYL